MKKHLAALAAVVITLLIGVTVAAGGSSGDPLVTKSYLEEVFAPSLEKSMQNRASDKTKTLYEKTVDKLDALGEADLKQAQAFNGGQSAYTPADVKVGDVLELKTGGSLVLFKGTGKVISGSWADVTDGKTKGDGDVLDSGHRYIVTSSGAAKAQVKSAGRIGYQGDGDLTHNNMPFLDVQPGDWYYDSVSYVYEKGYFSGVSEEEFAPHTSMNRAMLATVLYRLSGETVSSAETEFSDVPADQWFAPGIAWASKNKVVNGMGDGTYLPHAMVTREQMVTMLYRFQKDYLGKPAPSKGILEAFIDGDKVSSWAEDAMRWAISQKLITGRDTGALDPVGTATRAEVAIVIQRFAALNG